MRKRILMGLVALIIAVAGCQVPSEAPAEGDLTPITIAMGFVPNVQFAPMYVALERGYFGDEGIDLTLDYGMETDLLERVGAGEVPFAIASGDQVVLARASGLPVRYVMNWYRRFPVCVVTLASSGIEEPQDLIGRDVGVSHTHGASYIGWMGFLDEVGIDPEDVRLQAIGYTQVASLVEDRVDAAVCYAQNEPVQLRSSGQEINVFYLDEYTQLVSNGIIASDDVIAEHPDWVRGVINGFERGLADTLEDPEAAFAIARAAIPEMDDDSARIQRAVLDECVDFWRSQDPGKSDPAAWEASVTLLQKIGMLTTDVVVADLYTNEFVD